MFSLEVENSGIEIFENSDFRNALIVRIRDLPETTISQADLN